MKETIKKLKLRKAAIRTWLAQLHAEDRQIERAIKAIRALPVPVSVGVQPTKKYKMSAAGRRAIAASAKARWAKHNAANVAPAAPKKRKMSAATKAKLAAAQKARWAKIRAAQAKK